MEIVTLDNRSREIDPATPALGRAGFSWKPGTRGLLRRAGSTKISCKTICPIPGSPAQFGDFIFKDLPQLKRNWFACSGVRFSTSRSTFDRAWRRMGSWVSAILTAEKNEQLFVLAGFAHGFCTLEPESEVVYKTTDFYSPQHDAGIIWNDPDIAVAWPSVQEPILSEKDLKLPGLAEIREPF